MDTRKRRPNGTFEPGGKLPENARRAKGTLNKITRDIREGAIAGFARHGSNGRGEGGFSGFCYYLAKKHPKAAARIVEKLLPLVVNDSGLGSSAGVPPGEFVTKEKIAEMSTQLMIDHQPEIEQPAEVEQDVEAQSAEEVKLLAELHNLSREELLQRAGVSDDVEHVGFNRIDSRPQ